MLLFELLKTAEHQFAHARLVNSRSLVCPVRAIWFMGLIIDHGWNDRSHEQSCGHPQRNFLYNLILCLHVYFCRIVSACVE